MQKENREIVPGEGMPACSCQHFRPGSNVVPSPPPLSADEAGSRGWRGISLLKEWRDGNNRSGLYPEGMFEADSGHQTGTVKTTGVSHTSAPPASWRSRPVSHSVAIFMRREAACPHCCSGECQRGAKEKVRRWCASVHLVLVDCRVRASADSRSMSLTTKYGSLGLW